ncbi:MAG: helix-turn-helix transcriptional regulator, partial [Myxococcales bacterium]|nr:helix-turn-helix transcriptional regulator [Myxococcales bacterium]
EDELLTSTEVARLLRVHPKHLYRLLRQGLPGHRRGRGHWRFRRSEVLAWMDARGAGSSEPELETELVASSLAEPSGLASSTRVVIGRVGERWVAHALAPGSTRSADGLATLEDPSGHVRTSLLVPPTTLEANVLVAGCAPVLGPVLDRVERSGAGRAHWIPANSSTALRLLTEGRAHVAGIHLEDHEAGSDHAGLVRARLGPSAGLVRLVRWRAGLVLAPALAGRTLDDLLEPAVRWAMREPGSGAHAVLRRALERRGASPAEATVTVVAPDHAAVARAVAMAVADVGVCIEPVARAHGLAFVPLTEEGFDLVVTRDGLAQPHVARLLRALDDPLLRREITALGSYDAAALGHAVTP